MKGGFGGRGLVLELKLGSESNRANSCKCHNHWHLLLKKFNHRPSEKFC